MFSGGTPINVKLVVLRGGQWWLNGLLGFLRFFLSKKMSQRLKNVCAKKMIEVLGGQEYLPEGFHDGTHVKAKLAPERLLWKQRGTLRVLVREIQFKNLFVYNKVGLYLL